MSFLRLEGITKSFDGQRVLDGVDLEIESGEFFTLLGPSGCGKTTLLRIISGLEQPDAGRVLLGDRDLTRTLPERRPFNMVFQSYALFPHLNVADNVAYSLRAAGVGRSEIAARVRRMLALVDLEDAHGRAVRELSGGQQQRTALARALVNEPAILLLDEPLGALDLVLRKRLQDELRAIQQRVATTFVYVTHDQDEALRLSQRIAVMDRGRLAQVADPRTIYDRPASRFAAEFIGEVNLLPCDLLEIDGTRALVRCGARGPVELGCYGAEAIEPGSPLLAALRPQHLQLVEPASATFTGTVAEATFAGTHVRLVVDLDTGPLVVALGPDEPVPSGRVGVSIRAGRGAVVRPSAGGFTDE